MIPFLASASAAGPLDPKLPSILIDLSPLLKKLDAIQAGIGSRLLETAYLGGVLDGVMAASLVLILLFLGVHYFASARSSAPVPPVPPK